ncbi:hypothetical protein ACFLZP_04785, partial [Patescibacteria group bacterium]
ALYLWLIFGLRAVITLIKQRFAGFICFLLELIFGGGLVVGLLVLLMTNLPKNNLRNFYEFDLIGQQLLNSCPQDGVLFLRGDLSVFTASYANFIQEKRPDLKIVSLGYLKRAVYSYSDFVSLKQMFLEDKVDEKKILAAIFKVVSTKGWPICVNESIGQSSPLVYYPIGLVNVVPVDKGEPDYMAIHQQLQTYWQDHFPGEKYRDDPRLENYYYQNVLTFLAGRCLDISSFFFKIKYYDQARYWRLQAVRYDSDSKSVVRLDFLDQIIQKNCSEAKRIREEQGKILEDSQSWGKLELLYKETCEDAPLS